MRWEREDYCLTDEAESLDLKTVTALLQATYWAATRTRETIAKTIEHSLNFGLFHRGHQVGFARVVTDRATVGYLCDVVIGPDHRGNGLGKWMLQSILDHPELQTCRIDLFTKDAQDFYRQFGFGPHKFTNLVRYPPDYAGGGPGDRSAERDGGSNWTNKADRSVSLPRDGDVSPEGAHAQISVPYGTEICVPGVWTISGRAVLGNFDASDSAGSRRQAGPPTRTAQLPAATR